MITKRKARELENSRKFMKVLIDGFLCSPELYEMSVETIAGTVTLIKHDYSDDDTKKIGFKFKR